MFNQLFVLLFLTFCATATPLLSIHAYAEEPAKGTQADGEEEPHADFEHFQLNPLILPVISKNGVTQQVSLVISIEVAFGTKDNVKPYGPRLADAYLGALYGTLSSGEDMQESGIINIHSVKERLHTITTEILGEDKFHDVLLQVVHQRPM